MSKKKNLARRVEEPPGMGNGEHMITERATASSRERSAESR